MLSSEPTGIIWILQKLRTQFFNQGVHISWFPILRVIGYVKALAGRVRTPFKTGSLLERTIHLEAPGGRAHFRTALAVPRSF